MEKPGSWRADLYTWEMEGWPKYLGNGSWQDLVIVAVVPKIRMLSNIAANILPF